MDAMRVTVSPFLSEYTSCAKQERCEESHIQKLGAKLIVSLTILIVAISCISGYLNLRAQKRRMLDTMILGADQLSRSITSSTWHAMRDDDRKSAYEIMRVIADKQGVDRIRMFNREGRLVFSTDAHEHPSAVNQSSEVCASCHINGAVLSRPAEASRTRYATSPSGVETINMVTPIFNEPSCSNASCHAHQASTKVLGVLDVALRLDPIRKEARAMTLQAVLITVAEVIIGAAFVILFTRRFFATPVRRLIEGTKSVSAMELDRPIQNTHSSQELDELVDSFNQMRERLKAAVSELNEMQQTLESKVEERTRQLQTAEHKLLQADRLASHGQLAASVAHEINNPVAGVLNLSMLLERLMANGQFPVGREAEFRKYLGIISTETARVGRIVSDLLTFSRRSKPQRVLADLNKLVRTTLGPTDPKLLINTETVLDLQDNLPAVECDPSQIQQVILNLVLNGAQAMQSRGGGKADHPHARAARWQRMLSFLWKTRAKGSPRKTCRRFLIRSSPPNLKERESAWDWPCSTELSKAHDGEVEVSSRRDEGTIFKVFLPIKSRSNAANNAKVQVQAV